jgi:HEAT repeat protein
MFQPRGKRTVAACAVLAAATIVAAAIVGRDTILERWHLWRIGWKDPAVRKDALDGLVRLRSPHAVPHLLRDLEASTQSWDGENGDLDLSRRSPAFAGLLTIGSPAVPGLLDSLESGSPGARWWAARTLPAIDAESPAVLDALAEYREDPKSTGRWSIGELVRRELRKIEVLRALLDPDRNIRLAAASNLKTLGRLRRTAIPRLIDALGDEAPEVREKIAFILGNMKAEAEPALSSLEAMGVDPEGSVREAAEEAVLKITGHWKPSPPLPKVPPPLTEG